MYKTFKIAITALAVLNLLAIGSAALAKPEGGRGAKGRVVHGEIVAIGADSVTIAPRLPERLEGEIDAAGDMHLSLPIRTAVTTGGRIYYSAGGGIVADSDADAEYAESLLKAEGLLAALGTTFATGN